VLADYTLEHGGRRIRVGPIAFWTIVGTLVIMASWSLATATYFAFHDDLLTRLIARQTEVQYAYEDRIAELRSQVDRLTSRQLLDQEQYEQKLEQLVRKQALLESRATMLSGISDLTTGSIKAPLHQNDIKGATQLRVKPSPIGDAANPIPSVERDAQRESRILPTIAKPTTRAAAGIDKVLDRLQNNLDRIEANQTATLNALEESFENKSRRMRGVLADLGIDFPKPAAPTQVGGPFVPLKLRGQTSAFDQQLYRVSLARSQVERLTTTLTAVPIRKPVTGEIDTSSGFGMRVDPFLRTPAMHTGVDFRGDQGDPIRATAVGVVTQAGWSGGYGKMVEVDHGHGLVTRYGHLSDVEVAVGQTVRIGQVIGRLGSTGRSTGPHLHYETRVDGEAVDPQKFLRAGTRLAQGR
jgi:murein DD-endopeptidase MepM/ murein hydrolase activator NlpD